MQLPKAAITASVLILGIIIGFTGHLLMLKIYGDKVKTGLVQHREGAVGNVNPLLACDAASEILRDPEIRALKGQIEKFVTTRGDARISVYFRELNDGFWFGVGDTKKFIPASLRKVPLMIALLKQAETDKDLLSRPIEFKETVDDTERQNYKPSQMLILGQKYTVKDLIYRMIVYSDNNSFTLLTKTVRPDLLMHVYSDLRMLDLPTVNSDNFLSVQTYESFFRVLYNCSYLSREASDWALEILSKTEFRTGLVAGVPPTVKVAHKFGEHSDAADGTVQLHDCGIIYHPKHPYLLCTMSQGLNFETLNKDIAEVSRIIYSGIDAEASKN